MGARIQGGLRISGTSSTKRESERERKREKDKEKEKEKERALYLLRLRSASSVPSGRAGPFVRSAQFRRVGATACAAGVCRKSIRVVAEAVRRAAPPLLIGGRTLSAPFLHGA